MNIIGPLQTHHADPTICKLDRPNKVLFVSLVGGVGGARWVGGPLVSLLFVLRSASNSSGPKAHRFKASGYCPTRPGFLVLVVDSHVMDKDLQPNFSGRLVPQEFPLPFRGSLGTGVRDDEDF